jgi:hypothetical protein
MAKYDALINHFDSNPGELRKFKRGYETALEDKQSEFKYVFPWGQEWIVDVGYAKYFLEFLGMKRR